MQPYFYKLKHKTTGRYYVGSQYGKNSNPNNLWSTYFTSSKIVQKMLQEDGEDCFEIIKIVIRNDAREYERNYLKRCFYLLGRNRFLAIFLNRNIAPGILLTKEIIETANKKRKVSNSVAANKLLSEGRHNFQTKNASNYEHVRKQRSERMMGNTLGSKRLMSAELKSKLSEKAKGNTNVRGTKWWTDGIVNKRSLECPGEKFKLGTIKR